MGPRLTFLPFEQWLKFIFDHPVGDPQWYFDLEAPFWDAPAEITVDYISKFFENPNPFLKDYTDAQLNQGFWYLVSNGCSDMMFALTEPAVPLAQRLRCLSSFQLIFERVFAVRCSPHLSHCNEPGAGPLNRVCYMWWDLLPLGGQPSVSSEKPMDCAALEVMANTLALPSIACQESALHGLGHWHFAYPAEVGKIIDHFLTENPTRCRELMTYAQSARCGCVQ
jgi:hypothetical protein